MTDSTQQIDYEASVRRGSAAAFGPITDWATDFDILDPDYIVHPERRWAEQREGCPIAFTDRRQRTWLPVKYDDISAIAHDVDRFSSRDIAVVSPFDVPINDIFPVPPISSDRPLHTWARRLLLPAFGPTAIEMMTPITRALAEQLIEEHFADGSGDIAGDYARHIPVRIIAQMLGIPLADEAKFTGWVVKTLQEGFQNLDGAMDVLGEMTVYFAAKVAERRHLLPAAHRGDRHHVERDRLEPVAPGGQPGGSAPASRRSDSDPERGRGVPAGLQPGDDGSVCD